MSNQHHEYDEGNGNSADVMEIAPVSGEMAKIVIALAGCSGDGKTRSALELALGLADFNPEKIGLLDTENRRGSLYRDVFTGRPNLKGSHKFLIGDLSPPFSPTRFIQAMRQFAKKKIEVLIIDSVTHEWEGEGGCDEIAHAPKADGSARKMANWIGAKREHKKFVNNMLCLPFHVIVCVRAREKTDFKNPDKPFSLGIQPICEKNFMFEMTFSFLLSEQGQKRKALKLSDEFAQIVGRDGYLTPAHGAALRDWIGGFDRTESVKNQLRLAASEGTAALSAAWTAISKDDRKTLAAFKDTLKDLATHADTEAKTPAEGKEGGNEYNW